jgi:hypothetical protein
MIPVDRLQIRSKGETLVILAPRPSTLGTRHLVHEHVYNRSNLVMKHGNQLIVSLIVRRIHLRFEYRHQSHRSVSF